MAKKIILWSIYAGVVGVLIFGAVVRTEAKSDQDNSQVKVGLERISPESPDLNGSGNRWDKEGEENNHSEQGSGRNGSPSSTGEEALLAENKDHDETSLMGIVISLDSKSLLVEIDQGNPLEITRRPWRYILESGLALEVGDMLGIDGFYENGDFEIVRLTNLTREVSLQIREDSGRPLWSGGGGH
jgi:hypothetical protein